MPVNESTRKLKDRWPLEFDLAGVPTAERQKLLGQIRQEGTLSENFFAVDYQAGDFVSDINNPPKERYVYQEFPKMVYDHESGALLQVNDEKQQKAALKKGFQLKPSPRHDYSQVKNGFAAVKGEAPVRVEEISAEQLAELDAADEQ